MILNISPQNGGIDIIAENEKEGAFLQENRRDVYDFLKKYFHEPATKKLVEEMEKEINKFYKSFNYKNQFWDNNILEKL